MNIPDKEELIHLQIQAALRENHFDDDQMKYLGKKDGHHVYLIGGVHTVRADQFESFEITEEV